MQKMGTMKKTPKIALFAELTDQVRWFEGCDDRLLLLLLLGGYLFYRKDKENAGALVPSKIASWWLLVLVCFELAALVAKQSIK